MKIRELRGFKNAKNNNSFGIGVCGAKERKCVLEQAICMKLRQRKKMKVKIRNETCCLAKERECMKELGPINHEKCYPVNVKKS